MSTILKALRKLETEANKNRPWSPYIQPEGGFGRSVVRLLKIFIYVGMVAGIIGLVYFQILPDAFHHVRSIFVNTPPASTDATPAHHAQKISMKSENLPVPRDRTHSPEKPAPVKAPVKPTIPSSNPLSPADLNPVPEQTASVQIAKPVKDEKKRSEIRFGKNTGLIPAESAGNANPPKAERRTTDALPVDTSLDLQAIAWATDSINRIAVINGRIMKEGDTIEGYKIGVIDKDAVILHKEEKTVKINFRAK